MNSATPPENIDYQWMQAAIAQAREAENLGEVPVGAVVVLEDQIVARGQNRRERQNQATHHAEVLAIEEACQKLGRWRLTGCTLYVTLEPCVMCAGALINARVDRVVFGARDPKAGAVESLYQILGDARLNHSPDVLGGVLANECGQLLSNFFRRRRNEFSCP